MKNMKITVKLALSYSIMSLLAVILGVIAITGLITMSSAADDMYEAKAKPLGDLTTATEYFQRLRVQAHKAILYAGDTETLTAIEKDINDRFTQFETSMVAYKPTIASPDADSMFADIMTKYESSFKPGIQGILNGAKTGESATKLLADMEAINTTENAISNDMASLVQIRMGVMSDANDTNKKNGNLMLMFSILYIMIAMIVSTIFCLILPRSISSPIIFTKDVLLKIGSKGDLTFTTEERNAMAQYASRRDETGQSVAMLATTAQRLSEIGSKLEAVAGGDLTTEVNLLSDKDTMGLSLQKMVSDLNSMFHEINASSAQVSVGSKQISDGAQLLAQGSSEQAAAVEQLTSSMSIISDKITTSAETASRASALADSIKQSAEKGYAQMSEMISAVGEINQASQSISKVIKVIDDIAFQTNILALNAAVEAARAGQHGKGFAVVAEEVRSLAAKSADAAKNTGGLISNSIEKAELGARIADATGQSLTEIVAGINESAALVSEIAKSSGEQAAGIAQINNGIDQVAQVIQQNNAATEESAAASEEMSSQADTLEELITHFKLKSDDDSGRLRSTSKTLKMPDRAAPRSGGGTGGYGKY